MCQRRTKKSNIFRLDIRLLKDILKDCWLFYWYRGFSSSNNNNKLSRIFLPNLSLTCYIYVTLERQFNEWISMSYIFTCELACIMNLIIMIWTYKESLWIPTRLRSNCFFVSVKRMFESNESFTEDILSMLYIYNTNILSTTILLVLISLRSNLRWGMFWKVQSDDNLVCLWIGLSLTTAGS